MKQSEGRKLKEVVWNKKSIEKLPVPISWVKKNLEIQFYAKQDFLFLDPNVGGCHKGHFCMLFGVLEIAASHTKT